MNPVAYISDGGVIFKESPPDSILKLSPLYTSAEIQELHNLVKKQPMRELTDREIMELYCVTSDNDPLNFARAILQKASEK